MNLSTLPRYRSHKIVQAARIVAVHRFDEAPQGVKSLTLEVLGKEGVQEFDPNDSSLKQGSIFARYTPEPGDYLVVYQPDGYISISPKAAFEDGYTIIGDQAAA